MAGETSETFDSEAASPAQRQVMDVIIECINFVPLRYAPDIAAAIADRLRDVYEVRHALRSGREWPGTVDRTALANRFDALARLLVEEGHLTPIGARQINKITAEIKAGN